MNREAGRIELVRGIEAAIWSGLAGYLAWDPPSDGAGTFVGLGIFAGLRLAFGVHRFVMSRRARGLPLPEVR